MARSEGPSGASAGVDRSCAETVGGSDAAGRDRPVVDGWDALPGVRGRARLVGWLFAAGAGWSRVVSAAGSAGVLSGVRADARVVARVSARAPIGRGRRDRVRVGDGCRRARVSPIAVALGRSATTVRGWLRRLRARADVLRGWFVGLAVELAEPPARAPPGSSPSPLGLLLRVIADAFLAARLRLGPGAVTGGVWAFCSAATTGGLLANTSAL